MLDKYRDHAPADQPIIVTSRIIAATAERIFAAYSDAATIGLWWGPDGFSTTTVRRDFRIGGEWLYTMHGPDGTDYPNYSVFKEIEPNRRIVYDHGTAPDQPFLFTGAIQFEPVSGGTKVTILLTFAGTEVRDEVVMKYGAVEGGIQHLARLDSYVAAHP